MAFYRLWARDLAEREPLPIPFLVAMIQFDALGIQMGAVIDHLINHPEAAEAGLRLRDLFLHGLQD